LLLLMTDSADILELTLDLCNAKVDLATIGLELGFTWASGTNAATKLRHGASASGETGQLVFELCEFDLEV
jgi:hypothetical protein